MRKERAKFVPPSRARAYSLTCLLRHITSTVSEKRKWTSSVLLKPQHRHSQEGRKRPHKPLSYLWNLHGTFPGDILSCGCSAFCEFLVAPPVRHVFVLPAVPLVLSLVLERLHQQQARPRGERKCWSECGRISDTLPRVSHRRMAGRHPRRNCAKGTLGEGHGSLGMTLQARIDCSKLEPLRLQHHQKLLDSLPRHYCPNPRCSALVQLDEDSEDPQAICPSCNSVICVPCRVVWHGGMYQTGHDGDTA